MTAARPRTRRALRRATLALAVALAGGAALAAPASAASGFDFGAVRLAGADRVATAVAASQRAFAGGAAAVVLVNGASTVDGLTASYVAGLRTAPVLYTDAGAVPAATSAEVRRLGAQDVWVVGGEAVVSPAVAASLTAQGLSVHRLGGATRYETAALAATSGPATAGAVYLASGVRLADALVVGPLAYREHRPILLTEPGGVPAATSRALASLGAASRTVVGGTAVVPDAVASAAGATRRLAGPTRQGTAIAVATAAITEDGFSRTDLALAGGRDANAADALVAASVAGQAAVPLVLTEGDALGATTSGYLRSRAVDLTGTGYVLGGTAAVSDAVVAAADTAAANALKPTSATSPATTATLAVGAPRTYTVTGLDDASTYTLATLEADRAYFYADGSVTFKDAGGDGYADGLGATTATIQSVGASASGARVVTGLRPSGGQITYTLVSSGADRVNPVLFADQGASGRLPLDGPASSAQAKPALVPFAIGGQANWTASGA